MAKQTVNIGTSANKGNGDPLRTAFTKINANFDELYTKADLLRVVSVPASSIGSAGDFPGGVAFNATHFYYCFATYNGTTDIWKRIAWSNDTW